MEGPYNVHLREEYISRINKVQDYIEANISGDLSLVTLSRVANFSPYHFHRIFCAIIGEPLSRYIQRIRLERAALSLTANPKKVIAEIAYEYGFSTQASFSRAFKKHFGFSASNLRADTTLINSKKCKTESKTRKDNLISVPYNNAVKDVSCTEGFTADYPFHVEVRDIQEMPVIYIRNIGMFDGYPGSFLSLLNKLLRWAGARGLVRHPDTKILSLYHDNPKVTEESRFRTSICITVPKDTASDGEIGKTTIPGGRYAVGHFILDAEQYAPVWDYIIGKWLPENGFRPDDRPCFEIYLNDPREHPDGKSVVDMYIPVKPL